MRALCRTVPGRAKNCVNNHDGMALIITLFFVAVITALVVEFVSGVYVSTNALYNWQSSQRLSYVTKSAVKFASWIITQNASQLGYTYPGTMDLIPQEPIGNFNGNVSIRIENENIKFNLNTLVSPNGTINQQSYDGFVRMLNVLNLDPILADQIIAWVGPGSGQSVAGQGGILKQAPFDSVDELLTVPGITKDTFDALVPYVTIYGSGVININGAEIPVLMTLSNAVTLSMAERILQYRGNIPFQSVSDIVKVAGFETIGTSLMGHIAVKGDTFRVVATATDGSITKIVDSVLDMSARNPVVIYWKEL